MYNHNQAALGVCNQSKEKQKRQPIHLNRQTDRSCSVPLSEKLAPDNVTVTVAVGWPLVPFTVTVTLKD
jgi:hypothetical protein